MIKLNYKSIIRYTYILIILTIIICAFYLFLFLKQQVYYTLFPEKNPKISPSSSISAGNINVDKFESIMARIQKKSIHHRINNINDIFK